MQTVDEELIETVHLYVVREEEKRPYTAVPLFFALLCFFGIVAVTVYSANHPYYEHETLHIPAIFLPLQTFTATQKIIPTGVKTYGATTATGTLTVYNGSPFTQIIPKGMILQGKDGIQVITDESVTVWAGNPPIYGTASVSAHAVLTGEQGNIQAYDINLIYGSALYIRNLSSFHGGKDRLDVPTITTQDRQTATDAARAILATQQAKIRTFLAYPCKEIVKSISSSMLVEWACQYVTYSIPVSMKVTAIRLVGKILFVDVMFVPRPRIIMFK